MIHLHLPAVLRTVRRRRGYTLLNVSGLAVGLAACVLIVLYVRSELAYDTHHEHADRVFRVTRDTDTGHWAPVGPPLGPALRAALPEVAAVARLYPLQDGAVLRVGDRRVLAEGGLFADSSVFDVFTLPVLAGDPATALVQPGSVVLTASFAERLFGTSDAVGRSAVRPGSGDLTVTAVVEDPPPTTHLPFTHLVSLTTLYAQEDWLDEAWDWGAFYTYVLLRPDADAGAVASKLPDLADRFYAGSYDVRPSTQMALRLQPLRSIHLHSDLEKEYRPGGDALYVYLFGTIALFVLLIGVLNFINLTTAQSGVRLREVGVRKALGASRRGLVGHFLIEAVLLGALAGVAAYVLSVAALPLLQRLADAPVTSEDLHAPVVLLSLAGLALGAGLAGGLYPAIRLAGFHAIGALRGGAGGSHGSTLRRGLVVFQFALSIFLIAATAVVALQLRHVRGQAPGFDEAQVVHVPLSSETTWWVSRDVDAVRQDLVGHAGIESVSFASDVPGARYSVEFLELDGRPDVGEVRTRIAWSADHDYARTLGLGIVAGRDFSRAAPADTAAFLVNRAAVQAFGLDDPIGARLRWKSQSYTAPIVGIVDDFHFASMHDAIEPLVIPLRPGVGSHLLVRLTGAAEAAISHVEARLDVLTPGTPFAPVFIDEALDSLYRREARLSGVFAVFAGLAVFVACLGLFGLSAYTAERRRKEIGVRKVLGATVPGLVAMLAREFALLVGVAFAVAAPLAYLGSERWLSTFAYRVEPGVLPFVAAGAVALVVALVTVSYHALRAALADPVRSLRYE